MGDRSQIEWTDATWNPVVGCSIVSPGCTNCYAMKQAARIEAMHHATHMKAGGGAPFAPSRYAGTTKAVNGNMVWTGKVALAPEHSVHAPLRWKRPRRIFVNSMGDLFHEDVPDAWIDKVFAVMALAQEHTFQVLTKRAKRMREYVAADRFGEIMEQAAQFYDGPAIVGWPLPNVWLGVSAEDQKRADERIPDLLFTPAAKRFVSYEPALGPVDFTRIASPAATPEEEGYWFDGLARTSSHHREERGLVYTDDGPLMEGIDWIICGGESGPGARPMHPDWARAVRDQCAAASVEFFFKQWGEFIPTLAPSSPDHMRYMRQMSHLWSDGRRCDHAQFGEAGFRANGPGNHTMIWRVGKRHAGRLLDGVEHNGMPS